MNVKANRAKTMDFAWMLSAAIPAYVVTAPLENTARSILTNVRAILVRTEVPVKTRSTHTLVTVPSATPESTAKRKYSPVIASLVKMAAYVLMKGTTLRVTVFRGSRASPAKRT